ncbi:hypothetical protein CYMTET_30792, partial [Cymbomonas tetramitiformis]
MIKEANNRMSSKIARVFFQHIAKTGGTYLAIHLPLWLSEVKKKVLYDVGEFAYSTSDKAATRVLKECRTRCRKAKPTSGLGRLPGAADVCSREHNFATTAAYLERGDTVITILRSPIDRVVSQFLQHATHGKASVSCVDNVEELLGQCCTKPENSVAKSSCSCRPKCSSFASFQTSMLNSCATSAKLGAQCPSDLEAAIRNLRSFHVVGIMEHYGLTVCLVLYKLGLVRRFNRECLRT